jgi:hypothetical protein
MAALDRALDRADRIARMFGFAQTSRTAPESEAASEGQSPEGRAEPV